MEKTEDSHSSFLSYLFNEDLYIIPEKGSRSLASSAQPTHSGNIKKQVLIVTKENGDGAISAEHHEFMLKILQSVSLTWEDVQIIQDNQYIGNRAFEDDYLVVWGLGLAPQDIGLDPQNESYQIIDQEGSMKANDRFDGHIVQGHVDQTGVCISIDDQDGSWHVKFKYESHTQVLVEKGSVCINGVSLTCFDCDKDTFSVAIVPYTFNHTNFQRITAGQKVNLEFDILGKYVKKLLGK